MMRLLGSLEHRFFLASALLATLSIGAAVYFVSVRMTAELDAELQRDLAEAATLVDQQRVSQFESFTRTARLIADLPRFKAIVELGDRPTAEPVAREYRLQAGADLVIVTDRSGTIIALDGPAPLDTGGGRAAARVTRALAGESVLDFWPEARGLLQVVTVPVSIGLDRPEVLGTLTTGYLLDAARAEQFKAVTGADVAFALDGEVRASTLGPASHAVLAPLAAAGGADRVRVGDEDFTVIVKPLSAAPGTVEAGAEAPVALILRSRTEHRRTLAAVQTALAGLGLVTVLLAVAVSYGVARTITRPLAAITDHMREVAATGDLTRRLAMPVTRFGDEDAHVLARTFNTLTESIATFQREAAQRERLSSLGRMSTVLAHEIRNPLMIIKGALRQIHRADAASADVREAAADIDEEVERLNRLVNEVLDFARPIRFDRDPTDVNAVSAAAAEAVASETGPAITVSLDPEVPSILSDAERLRTALVNLLTNARQAVAAMVPAPGDAGDAPAVHLQTRRAGPGRVAITVSDEGPGVTADDLPRIFDPYFTTRRTGTGLGLPIAKNIVEGLGGSIAVRSRPGSGTDVDIELGDAPASRD